MIRDCTSQGFGPAKAACFGEAERDRTTLGPSRSNVASSFGLAPLEETFLHSHRGNARPQSVALCRSAPERLLGRASLCSPAGAAGSAASAPSSPPLCAPAPGEPEPQDESLVTAGEELPSRVAAEVPSNLSIVRSSPDQCCSFRLRSRVRAPVHVLPRHGPSSGRSCLRSPEPRAPLASNTMPPARVASLRTRHQGARRPLHTAAWPLARRSS